LVRNRGRHRNLQKTFILAQSN